jgi:phage-related protein
VSDWQLDYYETARGRCPVQEYLDGLSGKEAARVTHDLDLLETFGIALGAPYVKSLGQKLYELRTTGRPQHRVLYVAVTGRRLLLLHAFTKKTQKTPAAEIATARDRLADYEARRKG